MHRQEIISMFRLSETALYKILVYLLLLLCLGVAVKGASAFIQKHWIVRTTAESMKFFKQQDEKMKEYLDAYVKKTESLKEKGMFCIEKKKPSPPQVAGILGDSALMNGKWCKVGEEHAGAKIVKIEPAQIVILWEGKEMTLAPLLASTPEKLDEKPKITIEKTEPAVKVAKNAPEVGAEPVAVQQGGDDPLAWLGMEVSAELRAFLLKLFDAMPADQVESAKQEWANMSDEQKQKQLDEVQKMIDSGQADTMLEQVKASQG
jgi:hypothetical protein